jgi:isoaspartyl peptidase/L-asparaginase-like protein (Ntn-hydrolase superfamily)
MRFDRSTRTSLLIVAVGAIERVRNPLRVARAVIDSTPHLFLEGRGCEPLSPPDRLG